MKISTRKNPKMSYYFSSNNVVQVTYTDFTKLLQMLLIRAKLDNFVANPLGMEIYEI